MSKKNEELENMGTAPEANEGTAPDSPQTEEAAKQDREPLLEHHSPAAAIAYADGKPTKRILIRERRDGDSYRKICVGNNPPAILPTEVEVEVVPDEYYALKNSMEQRRKNKEIKKKLRNDYTERSKYL